MTTAAIMRAAETAVRLNHRTRIRATQGGNNKIIEIAGKLAFKAEVDGGDRVYVTDVAVDFLILATDFDFGSGPAEPADGLVIEELDSLDAVTAKFEMAPPYPAEPAWRHTDAHGHHLRIHTQERATA